MAKLTTKNVGITKTTNKAGGAAYELPLKEKLMTQVLTSFWNEDKYYGDNSKDLIKTLREMLDKDPLFVAKLAAYTRNVFHLRTISQVLSAEIAHHAKGKEFVRRVLNKTIERPDDMTNLLSYYIKTFKKPIPNSLKKGLGDGLRKFNEYSLAKYNRKDDVKLKDILVLCHPKPENEERKLLWKKILDDNMSIPKTWETELSAVGQQKFKDDKEKKAAFKAKWEDLIDNVFIKCEE